MKIIDLHMHSTYSDGSLKIEDLIGECAKRNIKRMSITDHYSVDAYSNSNLLTNRGIIVGVELGQGNREDFIHILGYGFDPCDKGLEKVFNEYMSNKCYCYIQRKRLLKKYNIQINDYENEGKKGYLLLGKKVKEYLHKSNEDNPEFLSKWMECENRFFIETEKKILLIKKAGGLSFWAHPCYSIKDRIKLEQKLVEYIKYGLDGIEVFNSSHTLSDVLFLIKLARKYNILISGGSDFHGIIKPEVLLGVNTYGNEYLEINLDRIERWIENGMEKCEKTRRVLE